jgi:hypothetical protein
MLYFPWPDQKAKKNPNCDYWENPKEKKGITI